MCFMDGHSVSIIYAHVTLILQCAPKYHYKLAGVKKLLKNENYWQANESGSLRYTVT